MANTNETSADIIAEIRDLAEGVMHCMLLPTVYGKPSIYLAELADRLEAARKREKAAIEADALAVGGIVEASRATTEKSSAVGDAAHRRELSKIASKNGVDFGQLGNAAKLREALEMARPFVKGSRYDIMITSGEHKGMILKPKDTLALVDAALAAPRKNCERFQTWDEAEEEYDRLVAAGVVEDGTWCEWLFALEGVSKGSEVRG